MPKVSTAAELSRQTRQALGGITQAKFAAILLVSRNYVSQIEAGLKKPSDRLEAQMHKLLTNAGDADKVSTPNVLESAGNYRVSGSGAAVPSTTMHTRLPTMLDPRFQPRAEPTPEMCTEYFEEYLRRAASEAGGVGYVWIKLQKQFPLEEFEIKSPP